MAMTTTPTHMRVLPPINFSACVTAAAFILPRCEDGKSLRSPSPASVTMGREYLPRQRLSGHSVLLLQARHMSLECFN
jgi:hypothetical protein